MQTDNRMVEEMLSDENLNKAYLQVVRNKAAERVMENISKFIENKPRFKVNMTKSKVSKPNDIKYLGFGFFKDRNDGLWKAKPHEKSIVKLKIKLMLE